MSVSVTPDSVEVKDSLQWQGIRLDVFISIYILLIKEQSDCDCSTGGKEQSDVWSDCSISERGEWYFGQEYDQGGSELEKLNSNKIWLSYILS